MSKNKILFLIINFFLLICESIEDKNNIFDNLRIFNSSNIPIKNIINRIEKEKYLRLLEDETTDDMEPIEDNSDSDDNDESSDTADIDKKNYIYVSFTLLQTRIKDGYLYLYVVANSTFSENINFNLSISVHLTDRIRNLEEQKKFINAKQSGSFKSNNIDNNQLIIILSADLNQINYEENLQNIEKIILNNIDKIDDNDSGNEIYKFDINLLENTDTSTQTNIDLSTLNENTIANIYIEEKMSSCSNELKFNLSVNNDIDINERNINLEFKVVNNNSNRRSFSLSVKCVLSSEYKRIIPCQLEEEPPQFSFTLTTFMEYIDNELIVIKPLNSDSTFTLETKFSPFAIQKIKSLSVSIA